MEPSSDMMMVALNTGSKYLQDSSKKKETVDVTFHKVVHNIENCLHREETRTVSRDAWAWQSLTH